MSVKSQTWRPTPMIFVEDVESRQTKLEYLRSPDLNANTQRGSYHVECKAVQPVITPELDVYVAPLSLCQPATATFGSSIHCLSRKTSESSFTSVDMGPASTNASWSSANSQVSRVNSGCFNIRSGLSCVSQAITGVPYHYGPHSTIINVDESMPEDKSLRIKSSKSRCSKVAVFFISLAIIAVIAAGIALYIEFVSKPNAIAQLNRLNETAICDLIVNGCPENVIALDQQIGKESTQGYKSAAQLSPVAGQPSSTSEPAKVANPPVDESGRVKATFSQMFMSKLNDLMKKS